MLPTQAAPAWKEPRPEKQMQKWMRWSLTMFRKYRLQYMRVGYFHQLSGNTNPKNTHSIIEATAKSGPWRLCTPKKHIFHVRGSWKNRVAHGSKMSENSNVMKPKCAKLVIFKKGVFLKCMFLMGFRKSSASTFCWRRRMPIKKQSTILKKMWGILLIGPFKRSL